jgi:hypothetical protein
MKSSFTLLVYSLLFTLFTSATIQAQTTIAFQGGEGTPADNWTFQAITNAGGPIPPGIVATHARTGAFAIRAGGGNTAGCGGGANCIAGGGATTCPMHGNTIQFDPINTACLSGVTLTVHHRSHTLCAGDGFDASDNLNFEVRLNGGAWTTIQTMAGAADYAWNYATNPAGSPATVPNPWVYNVPVGTNSFEFRVRATVNRSDEVFYLDDVRLTTTSTAYNFPGTAGLWNGAADDNWFNPCNWDNRQVPTAVTDVTFPPTTCLNDIVIQSGQNCICNNITLTAGAGHAIIAAADPTKMLTVMGNLTNNTNAGSTVLRFTDGVPGTPDGTLNLYGNWTNNSDANDWQEGNSTVNFLGSGNQVISLATAQLTEDFANFTVNKPAGDVVLNKSVQITGILTLQNGKITTAANIVAVANFLPTAVMGHSPASYVNGNLARAIQTGAGTRTYDFPLGTAAFYELASLTLTNPVGFTAIAGFFNPLIGGTAPNISEGGFLYDQILNAGVWTLAPDAPFVGTYDITLEERGYTNGGAMRYIDVKRDNMATAWTNPGTHVSYSEIAGVVTCSRSGLTAFSDFAIALSNTPFATGLIEFGASPVGGNDVALEWSWADQGVDGKFDIVREHEGAMVDLGEWEINAGTNESTLDENAPGGLLRYHLYHTDLNGNRSLAASDEVWNTATAIQPMLWPNPNAGDVNLQLGKEGYWELELVRIDGARMLLLSGETLDVEQGFEAAVQDLAAGVYIVKCAMAGEAYHLKMVRR